MKIRVGFDVFSWSHPEGIWLCNLAQISMSEKAPDAKRYVAVIEIPDFIPKDVEMATVLEVKEEQ